LIFMDVHGGEYLKETNARREQALRAISPRGRD
jgi:hypothetical protein